MRSVFDTGNAAFDGARVNTGTPANTDSVAAMLLYVTKANTSFKFDYKSLATLACLLGLRSLITMGRSVCFFISLMVSVSHRAWSIP